MVRTPAPLWAGAATLHDIGSAAMVEAFATERVGVFAYVTRDGAPVACAVTPFTDGPDVVVSSTLALPIKAAAVRRDQRVALWAGGALLRARAHVSVDLTSAAYDRFLRDQELAKYPPARSLLAVPGHRRWFWWYVGRVEIRVRSPIPESAQGSGRVTVTVLDADGPRIMPLSAGLDVTGDLIEIPAASGAAVAAPGGRACLLVHEEDDAMSDLRQLVLHGELRGDVFAVERRVGSLVPRNVGTLDQLRLLRTMSADARRHRPMLERWVAAAAISGASTEDH